MQAIDNCVLIEPELKEKEAPNAQTKEEKLIVRRLDTCIIGYNVWFTSDLHFSHKNILKHCPGRIEAQHDSLIKTIFIYI